MVNETGTYLPSGLPIPVAASDGLDHEFFDAANRGELVVQQCNSCKNYQFAPEWMCYACHSFDLGWAKVSGKGKIFSWERVWHPVHPALAGACPYMVVLVELPDAGNVRMVGNLMGDPLQQVVIGSDVEVVFEKIPGENSTLVQWKTA